MSRRIEELAFYLWENTYFPPLKMCLHLAKPCCNFVQSLVEKHGFVYSADYIIYRTLYTFSDWVQAICFHEELKFETCKLE